MDTALSPPVGQLLGGRYHVGSRIARGGMATVYLGTDTRLDRVVALKIAHPDLAGDAEFVRRFIGEARSVARLSSPNVVGVYDQGSDGGLNYIAMEYVAGRTLRQFLVERGRLTAREALDIMTGILSGLAAAHQAGIAHRDVKPENVLLTPSGEVKVADFGLARSVAGAVQTKGGMIIGTAAYLAPEQVSGGNSDARTDVYAAGIVLFELVTGAQPHTADGPLAVAYKHVNEVVPAPSSLLPGISPALDRLVAMATSRDPDLRPHDAGQFLRAIDEVRNGQAVAGTAPYRSPGQPAPGQPEARHPQPRQANSGQLGVDPYAQTLYGTDPYGGDLYGSGQPYGSDPYASSQPVADPYQSGQDAQGPHAPGQYPPGQYPPGQYAPGPHEQGLPGQGQYGQAALAESPYSSSSYSSNPYGSDPYGPASGQAVKDLAGLEAPGATNLGAHSPGQPSPGQYGPGQYGPGQPSPVQYGPGQHSAGRHASGRSEPDGYAGLDRGAVGASALPSLSPQSAAMTPPPDTSSAINHTLVVPAGAGFGDYADGSAGRGGYPSAPGRYGGGAYQDAAYHDGAYDDLYRGGYRRGQSLARRSEPLLQRLLFGRRLWFALGGVVVIAVAGGLTWWLGSGQYTKVPSLRGMSVSAATSNLHTLGLSMRLTHPEHSALPKGEVISISPRPGSKVAGGSQVSLTVSLGPLMIQVPDVTGQPLSDAQTALSQAHLRPGKVSKEVSGTVPVGDVITTTPVAYTNWPQSKPVGITISEGPGLANFVGQPVDTALATAQQGGFTINQVPDTKSDTAAGTITSQSPPANTPIRAGEVVTVHVSQGPPTVEVPDVRGLSLHDAIKAMEQAGFQVTVNPMGPGDRVGSYSPTTPEPKGTTITLNVGLLSGL